MSRSRRKTPIIGNHGASEKQDKRKANRALRRRVKQVVEQDDLDGMIIPELDDVSSTWSFDKDGKHYMHKPEDKWMRK